MSNEQWDKIQRMLDEILDKYELNSFPPVVSALFKELKDKVQLEPDESVEELECAYLKTIEAILILERENIKIYDSLVKLEEIHTMIQKQLNADKVLYFMGILEEAADCLTKLNENVDAGKEFCQIALNMMPLSKEIKDALNDQQIAIWAECDEKKKQLANSASQLEQNLNLNVIREQLKEQIAKEERELAEEKLAVNNKRKNELTTSASLSSITKKAKATEPAQAKLSPDMLKFTLASPSSSKPAIIIPKDASSNDYKPKLTS